MQNPHLLVVKKYVLTLAFCVVSVTFAAGQGLEIGGGLGLTNYKGEIYPKFKPFSFHGGANAFVRYNFVNSGVSLKATSMVGYLTAKDSHVNAPFHQLRGFSFVTNIWDAGLQAEYNFLNFRSTALHDSEWTPYVFGGFNYYSVFNSKYEVNVPVGGFAFTQYQTELKKSRTGYAIPFGVGFKKVLRPQLNLSVEFGTRKTFNDTIIDNIGFVKSNSAEIRDKVSNFANSVNSPNPSERRIATPNTRLFDMYYYTNISLSYVFYRVHCPPSR